MLILRLLIEGGCTELVVIPRVCSLAVGKSRV